MFFCAVLYFFEKEVMKSNLGNHKQKIEFEPLTGMVMTFWISPFKENYFTMVRLRQVTNTASKTDTTDLKCKLFSKSALQCTLGNFNDGFFTFVEEN